MYAEAQILSNISPLKGRVVFQLCVAIWFRASPNLPFRFGTPAKGVFEGMHLGKTLRNDRDSSTFLTNNIGEEGKAVNQGFEYNSGKNPHFLTIDELTSMNGL